MPGFSTWALVATLLLTVLVTAGCDRSAGEMRTLRLKGMPLCPRGVGYTRPVVVRLDRDPALFEDRYTVSTTLEGGAPTASLTVPRLRMKATLRVGLCAATSLATWDCAAATWIATAPVTLDGRSDVTDVELPQLAVPCADGSVGRTKR